MTVELRDASGTRNPKAGNLLAFEIEEPATIAGVGNSNPASVESYQRPERKTWQGRGLVIVKSGNQPGDIRLKVSSAGLPGTEITIRSTASPSTAVQAAREAAGDVQVGPRPDVGGSRRGKGGRGLEEARVQRRSGSGDVTFADVRHRGKPATSRAKVADGHLGDVAVQWIQPLEGGGRAPTSSPGTATACSAWCTRYQPAKHFRPRSRG